MFEGRSEHLSRTAILASLYHGSELEKLTFVQPAAIGKMGSEQTLAGFFGECLLCRVKRPFTNGKFEVWVPSDRFHQLRTFAAVTTNVSVADKPDAAKLACAQGSDH